ncbi:MAG TPA: retropepsin-like aspartic protease [Gemmatimonadaceae bacterium]|nr:retropepsin-like aspartic protease [Gemmatimonadaceae bacterium]
MQRTRLIIAAFAVLGNASCASKPVEVTTGAIVSLDTTTARVASPRSAPAKTFWAAMTSLDPDYVHTHSVSIDERQFANALRTIMAGDIDEAELLLDSLGRHATDSLIRSASHILLTATLQYQNKWKQLAEIAPPRSPRSDSIRDDRAGVERWADAFRNVPTREISFPSNVVTLPLSVSAAGTPAIQVIINGKPKVFWLDTGSSMSIVASDVAEEFGVAPLVADTLEVATTTGRVPARPAAIRSLELGGVSIQNATAMIVSSALMQIRSAAMDEPGPPVKINGIVGFDIISQLDIQVDYVKGVVRLSQPQKSPTSLAQRNFFWVGTPIVRLISRGGLPLHFGLDTGAQETYAMERLLNKAQVRTFLGERKRIGGFAGLKEFRGRFIPDLRLSLAGTNLIFQKLLVFTPAVSSFIALDGVLGSDAGKTGVMRIDAMNGVFSIGR